MAELILNPGKERSLLRRHLWIFAGSVKRLEGRARAGDTVTVVSAEGKPLARAAWSRESRIQARVWSFDPDAAIDHAFFKRTIAAAVARPSCLIRLRAKAISWGRTPAAVAQRAHRHTVSLEVPPGQAPTAQIRALDGK